MGTEKPRMSLEPELFGGLGDFHPTLKKDGLKPISSKKFNEFITDRRFKGRNVYVSEDLKAMFSFKPMKADRAALVVSSKDMEPAEFHSMREATRAICIGE